MLSLSLDDLKEILFLYSVIFDIDERIPLLCCASSSNKQKHERQARAVTICQEVFEWTVYLPFGSDDTI